MTTKVKIRPILCGIIKIWAHSAEYRYFFLSFLYKKRMYHADTPSFCICMNQNYMRSGTSMPKRAIPLLMILATFLASMRRTARLSASGSLRIE